MSKEKRREMENSTEKVYLEEMNHSIRKSVNAYIRELDAEIVLYEEINEKFKEYAQYVDFKARYSFYNPTSS